MAGKDHPKFAECLSDYAFYLLNVDGVAASVDVYKVSKFPSPFYLLGGQDFLFSILPFVCKLIKSK